MSRFYLYFLVVIFIGLGAYYIISSGIYPFAIVNGQIITTYAFEQNYLLTKIYYQDLVAKRDPEINAEIKGAALDKTIENTLIYQELRQRMGEGAELAVEERIVAEIQDKPQLASAVQKIYKIGFDQFKHLVLVPQARMELLEAELKKEDRTLEGWLAEKKKSATVKILSRQFRWSGAEVVLR